MPSLENWGGGLKIFCGMPCTCVLTSLSVCVYCRKHSLLHKRFNTTREQLIQEEGEEEEEEDTEDLTVYDDVRFFVQYAVGVLSLHLLVCVPVYMHVSMMTVQFEKLCV